MDINKWNLKTDQAGERRKDVAMSPPPPNSFLL